MKKKKKADNGNRTHMICLEGREFTINLYPHLFFERVSFMSFCPSSSFIVFVHCFRSYNERQNDMNEVMNEVVHVMNEDLLKLQRV